MFGVLKANHLFYLVKFVTLSFIMKQLQARVFHQLKFPIIKHLHPHIIAIDEIKEKATSSSSATQLVKQIDDLYIPLYTQIMLNYKSSVNPRSTFFVGVSAPQGCGKTTLTEYLKILFDKSGFNCLSISIDDFYLTGEEQDNLANKFSSNPLLKYRGNAGTHDIDLLLSKLNAVRTLQSQEDIIAIPRYDKSLRDGRGDRAPVDSWTTITGPVNIVLLEGWMLGFQSIPTTTTSITTTSTTTTPTNFDVLNSTNVSKTEEELIRKHEITSLNTYPGIQDINQYLSSYQRVHDMMDMWIILGIEEENKQAVKGQDYRSRSMEDIVYGWRWQAEEAMRNSGKLAMTQQQVKDFVNRFMPAYYTYLPRLYTYGPVSRSTTATATNNNQTCSTTTDTSNATDVLKPVIKIMVDEKRTPVSVWSLQ